MPTHPEHFQRARLPWSRWKHILLLEYLKIMPAVLRVWEVIYYVDGFAGPGRYTDDEIDGSPLLAAQHARMLASTAEYSLQCINVESDAKVFQNLQTSLAGFGDHTVNFSGEFGQYVPEILRIVGDKPTLFFLDPIGVKGLEWSALLPVFRRESTTELLVRFDAQTAMRLTGSGAGLHKTFNSILGEENSDYWRDYVANCEDGSQAKRDCLTKAYEDKLAVYFPYVGRIPIKSSDDSLKYYLLFATRSLKGMQVMNDVCFKVQDLRDRTLDEERRIQNIPQQMTMFQPSEEDKALQELEILKSAALDALGNGETIKRDELRGYVASLEDNFGRFSGSQFTAILGGAARKTTVPREFRNIRNHIQIHNNKTPGVDTAEISLKR